MASPALRIPVSADVSKFQQDMQRTSDIATKATLAITKQVISMNASWIASQGAVGAATLAFGRVLGVLGPIALGITAVRDAFKLMGYATDLAKARIDEFNKVTEEANASGFSTEFFQRITKSGGEARDKIDDITEALKKFNAESTPKLGGSALQNRLDSLTKAGNGTPGAQVSGNDSEGRLRSAVTIIDDMLQKGQRLAALDLTETAFGPKVAAALRADSNYLNDMLRRADAIKKTQLISDEDLGRAQDLTRRMDEAQKILADKWKPIQDDLAKLGTNYHENWVYITQDLAAAVGYATQLYQALEKVPDWFAKKIGGASIWTSITSATTTPESRAESEASLGISSDPKDIGMVAANNALRAALQNYNNVKRGMQQATDVQTAVRGDTSKDDKDDPKAQANAYDTAAAAIERHTARTIADTQAVGLGAATQAEFRANAALTTAAIQAGLPITQAMKDHIQDLAQDAGDAAEAFQRAKVASDISFGKQTAFLTSDDVALARQLAGIYGNDVPAALASSEAAALRLNNAMSEISGKLQSSLVTGLADIVDGTKSASQGFADLGKSILRMLEEAAIKAAIVKPLLSGLGGIFGSFGLGSVTSAAAPTGFADGGIINGSGGPRSDNVLVRASPGEFIMNAAATAKYRPMIEAMNQMRLPRFADGGMVSYPGGEGKAEFGKGKILT